MPGMRREQRNCVGFRDLSGKFAKYGNIIFCEIPNTVLD